MNKGRHEYRRRLRASENKVSSSKRKSSKNNHMRLFRAIDHKSLLDAKQIVRPLGQDKLFGSARIGSDDTPLRLASYLERIPNAK